MQDGTTSGSFHQLSFLALWWNIYSANVLPLLEKFQKMEESESEECKVINKELMGICWNHKKNSENYVFAEGKNYMGKHSIC